MRKCILIALPLMLLAVACGDTGGPRPSPDPMPPEAAAGKFRELLARAPGYIDEHGWVVSRKPDGSAEHVRDSLTRSGSFLGALPCAGIGDQLEQAMAGAIEEAGGALMRHPTVPDEVSLDGALAFYFGVTSRAVRCPGSRELWQSVMQAHKAFVARTGKLGLGGEFAQLPPGYDLALDAAANAVGAGGEPSQDRKPGFALALSSFLEATRASQAPCYRVHISWLPAKTLDLAGFGFGQTDRGRICAGADGLDIPLMQHWCGRDDLKAWVAAFQYDVRDFRFDRCPAWESPDGAPTRSSPAIDLAEALREAFTFPDEDLK